MIRALSFYNNKGGVSKTTTAFNLAVFLASRRNKKVLVIDADPQSNITEMFFASDPSFWDSVSEQLPGDSIYDAFRPRLEGNTSRIDVSKVRLSESKRYKNLFLLRGDINFSALAEGYFSSAVEQSITTNINQKHTYLSFRRLAKDFIAEHKFDHVVFDLGPSTGAISRLVLLACDGYFVPITPDRFSALAVKSLPRVLIEWFDHDRMVRSTLMPYGLEDDYPLPQFCGAISQQFQVHRGKIKKSYERWSARIEGQLKHSFLEDDAIPISTKLAQNPMAAKIENLGPLVPVAQYVGKAIFDLTQEDTKHASSSGQMFYGAVFEPWIEKIRAYEGAMDSLAKALE